MIQLVKPCRGHVTQRYGAIQSQDGRKHTGQDYAYYSAGQVMDEVFAAADGVVLYAGDSRNLNWPNAWYLNPDFNRNDAVDSSAGNVVVLGHKQGTISFDTTYNHLAAWTVKAGDPVRAGQRIATIGATGYSAGKHLHFELLFRPFNFGTDVYGRADPNPYFATGIAPAGTTTTSKEDDLMPRTNEERAELVQIVAEGFDSWATGRIFPDNRNFKDLQKQIRTDIISTKEAVEHVPETILYEQKEDGRSLFDWFKQLRTDIYASEQNAQGLDVQALATAIAEQLPTADAEALVDALAARLAGGK